MLGFVSNSTFFLLFFPFSLYVTQAARASDKARPQEYMRGFVSRELSNSAVSETEEESSSYEDGTGSHRSLYYYVSRELSNSAVSETEEESSSYEDGTGSHRSLYFYVSRELSNSAVSETEEESSSYEDGTGSHRSLYCWYVHMFYCYFTPPTAPLLISYPCYRLLDALALHKWSDLTSQYRPGRSLLDS